MQVRLAKSPPDGSSRLLAYCAAMVQFGSTEVDLDAREVRRAGRVEHLEPQAFDVLAYLIEHRDRVVPKPELLDAVWGDQFVSDAAITTRVKEIRQALGDDGRSQGIIRTIRGHGYRFVAEVSLPHEAPSTPSWLVGRDDDLREVADLLRPGRCVTVVGPGGVGKTSLATVAARGVAAGLAGGLIVVDLGAVEDAGEVLPAVLAAAGVDGSGASPGALLDMLAARNALLLLDNCEHVVDRAARLVDDLVARGGPLQVLATSQERLGVDGERVWPLLPLEHREAVALLLERATGRSIGPEDAGVVGDLVEAVDRLPLGLEMAAALLGVMSPADALALVVSRPDLVLMPRRHAEQRHQTLETVVARSFGLLPEDVVGTAIGMSCFAGPVTAADVAGVLASGDEGQRRCWESLRALVERSLVSAGTRSTPTRYLMLQTVRTHAQRLAENSGRTEQLAHAHAAWFLEVATDCDSRLRGPDEAAAAHRLSSLIPEFRAAQRWARVADPELAAGLICALELYAHTHLWAEPADWARAVLGSGAVGEQVTAPLLAVVAADAAHRGHLDEAVRTATEACTRGDPRTVASALETLSDVAVYQGRTAEAVGLGSRLAALGARVLDPHATVIGGVNEALGHVYGGRPDLGLAVIDGLEASLVEVAPSDRAWLAYVAGEARGDDDPTGAAADLERAVVLADSVGNRLVSGVARTSQAALLARTGDLRAARPVFSRVVADFRRQGDVTHLVTVLRNLVVLLVDAGEPAAGIRLHAALSVEGVKASYGAELDRLDTAMARAAAALDAPEVARQRAAGLAESLDAAAAGALDGLTLRGD